MSQSDKPSAPVLFVSHGGGPLPLLGDPGHQQMVDCFAELKAALPQPKAILVISAHWEAPVATVTRSAAPGLIYDYSGFPEAAYHLKYPAPGAPELADQVYDLLQTHGLEVQADEQRGFDHGLFVPLLMLYPDANIPCLQLSLLKNLDPQQHIALGQAIRSLREQNVMILGSGFTFHNLPEFFSAGSETAKQKNEAFENWLIDTLSNAELAEAEREQQLLNWEQAPHARYSHPREEHLLPLHVCFGCAGRAADKVFTMQVLGKQASCYLWQ
ncbi:DODA-type extradiol aromatic ring-opening family dioxygenase [Pontibacter sp. JAM-7]|uniref:DODA-type extradiol aromatic ring-opening family dioxygenase n=1 Tax=Pontibacter sp. JAM-7 TaxID=3366581 RepID=UPI003AF58A48